jgi:hypothetical protein
MRNQLNQLLAERMPGKKASKPRRCHICYLRVSF